MADETPDVDQLDDAELDLEKIAEEAQENPDLYAFLTGVTRAEKTSTLFLGDPTEFAEMNKELKDVEFRADFLHRRYEEDETEIDAEERAGIEKQFADLDAELESARERAKAARDALFQTAVVVKLRAVPNESLQAVRRRARKVAGPGLKSNDIDAAIRFNEATVQGTLAKALVSVVIPGGKEVTGNDKLATAKMLEKLLPPTQWDRLVADLNELMSVDKIQEIAISDPGFLAES